MTVNATDTPSKAGGRDKRFILFDLTPEAFALKGIAYLFFVYFFSLLFAATVAPWIYHFIQELYSNNSESKLLRYLAYKGFDDYFDRLRWVPVVFCLPWLFIKTRLYTAERLGLSISTDALRSSARWWLIGALLLSVAAVIQFYMSPTQWKPELSISFAIPILLKAVTGGILLGLLEEILFRGLILRIFYTAFTPFTAIIIASLFFAWMHFKMPDSVWQEAYPPAAEAMVENAPPPDAAHVNAGSGFFVALWTCIGIFADFQALKFINLTLLGIILCSLTLKFKSLMPAIGLHAGLVTIMLSFGKLADVNTEASDYHTFLGGRSFTDGVLAFIILTALTLWVLTRKPVQE